MFVRRGISTYCNVQCPMMLLRTVPVITFNPCHSEDEVSRASKS